MSARNAAFSAAATSFAATSWAARPDIGNTMIVSAVQHKMPITLCDDGRVETVKAILRPPRRSGNSVSGWQRRHRQARRGEHDLGNRLDAPVAVAERNDQPERGAVHRR